MIAEARVITSRQYPGETEFTHAGVMERAAVLAYVAELVRLDEVTEASDHAAGEAAHGLYRRADVYPVLSDFRDIAPPAGTVGAIVAEKSHGCGEAPGCLAR